MVVEGEEFSLVDFVVQHMMIDMGMYCMFPTRNFEGYTLLMGGAE